MSRGRPVALPPAWRWRALAVLAGGLLLGACGFHPRGAVELPRGVSTVYVEAASPLIARPLEATLEAGGARLASRAAEADLTLAVSNEATASRLAAVDPRTGKAREYELSYALTYQVRRTDGSVILAPETVRLVRDYTFEPTEVIAKGEEEALIFSEMRRDAIQQILRRLRVALRGASPVHAGQP